jgi:hypothetical protein
MSKKTKVSMKQRILDFFRGRGAEGATADEAVTFFGSKHYSSVTARITEMVNSLSPKLYATGRYRRTRRGGYGAILVSVPSELPSELNFN